MRRGNPLLMIFVKNPVPGEVKTRLASGIGEEQAAAVYRKLLEHTRKVTLGLPVQKQVWYTGEIKEEDPWSGTVYEKKVQAEGDLGMKLAAAFEEGDKAGFDRLVAIGSDCIEITEDHLADAFAKLNSYDIVLGPAGDGGYYLAGMREPFLWLFSNMPWSSSELFPETVTRIKKRGKSLAVLPVLNDIDTVEDLKRSELDTL